VSVESEAVDPRQPMPTHCTSHFSRTMVRAKSVDFQKPYSQSCHSCDKLWTARPCDIPSKLPRSVTVPQGDLSSSPRIVHSTLQRSVTEVPQGGLPSRVISQPTGEVVPGLAAWLLRLGLFQYGTVAANWVEAQGACDLDELVENFEDFADELKISALVREQCRKEAHAAAAIVKTQLAHRPPFGPASCVAQTLHHAKPASLMSVGQVATMQAALKPVISAGIDPCPKYYGGNSNNTARTITEQWDEAEAAIQQQVDAEYKLSKDPQVHLPKRQQVREERPPIYRNYVSPQLLRARIPHESELRIVDHVVEVHRESTKEKWGDARSEHFPNNAVDCKFDRMRASFINQHGDALREELGQHTEFVPADLSCSAQQKFLTKASGRELSYGFHGTRAANIQPILKSGLRIPGNQSGVKVENGSVHGVGIYTALPGQSWLSKDFCDSEQMLVCGIVDPGYSQPAPIQVQQQPHRVAKGHRQHHRPIAAISSSSLVPSRIDHMELTRETDNIRQVGAARVIFNENVVAPLFVAQPKGYKDFTTCQERGGKHQTYIAETGDTLWRPPTREDYRDDMRVKRRVMAKERQAIRACQRDAKSEANCGHWS